MPVFVGPGSAPDGGFEGKSDRVGFPTATSNPGSAVLGDMFLHTVGAGATLMMHNGTEFVKADGSGSISMEVQKAPLVVIHFIHLLHLVIL